MLGFAISLLALVLPQPARAAASPAARAAADLGLARTLTSATRHTGSATGVLVVDLSARRTLWSLRRDTRLLPASTEKLYTTATALKWPGARARLRTRVFGSAPIDAAGTLHGDLYLRGGGDPTFGGTRFDRKYYGRGATVEGLARAVVAAGVSRITGRVIGDEGAFDTRRGTQDSGYARSSDVTGLLSALTFDRGLDPHTGRFQSDPAAFAASKLATALRARRVSVRDGGLAGTTPPNARELASVSSPSIGSLIRLANVPSDNFFAEMLLKDVAIAAGDPIGTSAGGARHVRAYISKLGIHASVHDGSGLSRLDATSASELVRLLDAKRNDPVFTGSLAIAGRSGTIAMRMRGTAAEGACQAKTGSFHDVSNLAGYCTARDGHLLAFAILMNRTTPYSAHPVQDRIAVALARYAG